MIFTSYYAKMSKFPSNIVPVSISRGVPKWYSGATMESLAPSWDILNEYKNSTLTKEEKECRYNERYNNEILKLPPFVVTAALEHLLPKISSIPIWQRKDMHIALLCYEKSEDFCHRKLVADWLNKNGIFCKELTDEDIHKIQDSLLSSETHSKELEEKEL